MKVRAPKIKHAALYEHQTCWKLLQGFAKWVLKNFFSIRRSERDAKLDHEFML